MLLNSKRSVALMGRRMDIFEEVERVGREGRKEKEDRR